MDILRLVVYLAICYLSSSSRALFAFAMTLVYTREGRGNQQQCRGEQVAPRRRFCAKMLTLCDGNSGPCPHFVPRNGRYSINARRDCIINRLKPLVRGDVRIGCCEAEKVVKVNAVCLKKRRRLSSRARDNANTEQWQSEFHQ